jgi:DNA-binding NtrC family response regulator
MNPMMLRCIVVEDNDAEFVDIRDAIRTNILGQDGIVDQARSFSDYLECQRKGVYDIVVLDIKLRDTLTGQLNSDEDGGMRVSRKLRVLNPGAVVILFSQWVNVKQTVIAMRNGAWDAILKLEDPRKEALIASIKDGMRAAFFHNEWFARNADRLADVYGGEYVAIAREAVVAHNSSLEELRRDLRAQAGEEDSEDLLEILLVPMAKKTQRLESNS